MADVPAAVRGEKADTRSDVLSLGAVFYELLANRKPFDADSLHAVLFQVMQSEPEPLLNLVPDLPTPDWLHAFGRLMAPLVDATPEAGAGSLPEVVSFVRNLKLRTTP